MIEEPPLLIIRENHPRPSAQQLQALAGTPTGFLADAMKGRGALPAIIRHVSPGILPVQMCGVALTCECGPADVLAVSRVWARYKPGTSWWLLPGNGTARR